jgi:hypothetical protein
MHPFIEFDPVINQRRKTDGRNLGVGRAVLATAQGPSTEYPTIQLEWSAKGSQSRSGRFCKIYMYEHVKR